MQELEKILEEIRKIGNIQFSSYTKPLIAVEDVEKIIRKHMAAGWIPVEEKLPEEGEIVLATYRTGCGEYDVTPDQWYKSSGWESALDDDIVAWRPLPDPYRPERCEGE